MQIEKYDKPAELRLIEACREGDDTIISMERPEKGSADNTIRAGLIRALLLGTGDCTPPARGLWIRRCMDHRRAVSSGRGPAGAAGAAQMHP